MQTRVVDLAPEKPWLAHYDRGVPASIDYPDVTIFHFLQESARKYPERPCTIFKGARITYREMDRLTDQLAGALAGLGVKKGDPVGILMPNTPQFVMVYFGILKAGGVVVAVNSLYTSAEIAHQVNDAGLEILFVMTNFYGTVKAAQANTRIRTLIATNIKEALPPLTGALFGLLKERQAGFRIEGGLAPGDLWLHDLLRKYPPESRPRIDISPDDVAIFQYSGGTTGISKGAVALHRNVVANTLQIKAWFVTMEDGKETLLMAIPLFHVYGMVAGMMYAIAIGASLVMIPNPRDVKDVLGNIDKYHPTTFPGVPTLYNAINSNPSVQAGKHDLRSIKSCISGSAPLMRETKERFEALSGGVVFEGYGLSEAPTATHCNPLLGVNKTGSIGMPMPDVECRIVNLDDGETTLPIGEVGELAIHAPQVMRGYHNMPTETENTLRTLDDGRKWRVTGDIARMDEDGYFYIVDRKKELIKPGGFQVWPREVEEALTANPKVLEAGVAGVPDAYRGETVKAWIVLQSGATMTEGEVRSWCRERLAAYKIPTQVEFRTELPKTMVGKILRRELVRQHQEGAK
jgi:long-chain acyl-CoA synthetase